MLEKQPVPPSGWFAAPVPLYFEDITLPEPPAVQSAALAREFCALKDALYSKSQSSGALVEPYELDVDSNKVLEMGGDTIIKWAYWRIARRRHPRLAAAGISVSSGAALVERTDRAADFACRAVCHRTLTAEHHLLLPLLALQSVHPPSPAARHSSTPLVSAQGPRCYGQHL